MRFTTARAAGAVWLVLVAGAVTACGSGGGSGGGGATTRAAAPGSTPQAAPATTPPTAAPTTGPAGPIGRTLSQPELYKAFVTPKELPGWTFGVTSGNDPADPSAYIPNVSRLPPVSPAACTAVSRMGGGIAAYRQPRSLIEQNAQDEGTGDAGRGALVELSSYAPADAPKVIDDLRASLKTCTSYQAEEGLLLTEPKVLAAPAGGDDAVAYEFTQVVESIDDNGDPDGGAPVRAPIQFNVVRVGTVVAAFWVPSAVGEHNQVPAELVAAQVAKLEKTPARGRPTTT